MNWFERLTVKQWLALDEAGTFLAGCAIFFYSGYLLCRYDDMGVVFIAVLYTFPVPLALDLAALFFLIARDTFPAWRIFTAVGAVIQIAVSVYNYLLEWRRWSDGFEILDLLMFPVLIAGIVGLGAALFIPRQPKPPKE